MVRLALADGDNLPRSAPASGGRDAKAVVGVGDPKDHPCTLGPLLACYPIGPPANCVERAGRLRRAAWYRKPRPTFSDALALVRKELWAHATFRGSLGEPDTVEVPRSLVEHLTETLCYAA